MINKGIDLSTELILKWFKSSQIIS
jgi:hypothetical protein